MGNLGNPLKGVRIGEIPRETEVGKKKKEVLGPQGNSIGNPALFI